MVVLLSDLAFVNPILTTEIVNLQLEFNLSMLNWRWLHWLVNFLKFELLLVTLSSALTAWK